MTDDRMALLELIEKGADGDLVRDMLAFAAERIMEIEVEARTGAGQARSGQGAGAVQAAAAGGQGRSLRRYPGPARFGH